MKIKEELQNAFQYLIALNHREVNSIMLMSAGIIVVLLIPALVKEILYRVQPPVLNTEIQILDSLLVEIEETHHEKFSRATKVAFRFQIPFDPNAASTGLLDSIGIPPWVAKGMVNYRNKGGKFKSKKDVKKMYGLADSVFARIQNLILLPDSIPKGMFGNRRDSSTFAGKKTFQPKPKWAPFNLNLADTFQLDKVFGIGMKSAKRIAKYRDELGGFINYEQLHGVWGLDSLVIETLQEKSFIAPDFAPQKVKINSATEEQLATHPFIRKTLARYISRYRKQHGAYHSVDDILKIKVIQPGMLEKLIPYLDFEQPQ